MNRNKPLGRVGKLELTLILLMAVVFSESSVEARDNWIGSWGASPAFAVGPELLNATARQVVRVSAGGSKVRIRFTNETGTQSLTIGSATLARPAKAPGAIELASVQRLTFGGATSICIPPGAPALSDPVDLVVAPLDLLTISFFVPRMTGPAVAHTEGEQTAWISQDKGDETGAETLTSPLQSTSRLALSRVEVAALGSAIVTLGDSITDGAHSGQDMNRRWPDVLASRLAHAGFSVGVVNSGIGGNRILHDLPSQSSGPNALSRFDRDVLSVAGVRWVIILEGINDIGYPTAAGLPEQSVSAEEIIGGWRQLIARAHAGGIQAYCGTLTPFEGKVIKNYYTADGETKRQELNNWIRTSGKCDAVIDFDAAIRDPANPGRLKAEYDSGDHLHPGTIGYEAMGKAVDLQLFKQQR